VRDDHARSHLQIAREEPDITIDFTAHQHYVIKRTVSLRLAKMAEELARHVHADRYTESGEQTVAKIACEELMEVLSTL
jgi:hypothetical protein